LPAPLYVLPNGGGWAYGGFVLDKGSLEYFSQHLHEIRDPLTRGAAWVTMWDALLNGQVTASTFAGAALTALPRETDEQLTSRVLGYFGNAWWRFLTAAERQTLIGRVEAP
jgi:aminopeptidase N